jgi:hypothetical protein
MHCSKANTTENENVFLPQAIHAHRHFPGGGGGGGISQNILKKKYII